jgi:hypothetical protein
MPQEPGSREHEVKPMKLQERLDAFKASFESGAPPFNAPRAAVEIMHRATEELHRSGQAERALGVGARAPAFALSNQDGQIISSADLLARGPLVISFFRGHW